MMIRPMTRLCHVRFEGEIRFPGVARNATTFGESEGYEIAIDADCRAVIVSSGARAVIVPWTRVLEAVPWSSPEPSPSVPESDATAMSVTPMMDAITSAAEPPPAPRARRGRRPAQGE
jgi:hypothetical protein